ncbi:hypothetical protein Tco_1436138 [Tanacetum coccineum]
MFSPPTIDLSSSGLKEFQQPKFEGDGVNVNKSVSENSSNVNKRNTGATIIEDWVSDCDEDECEEMFGLVPISTARQSSSRTAATVSTARPIKTIAPKPFMNVAKSRPNAFQKSHSPSRRPFYQQTTLKNRNLNNKVNTVKVNSVNIAKGKRVTSAIGEQGIDAVKSKACWVWRPKLKVLDHVSKNSRSYMCKQFDYVDPTGRVKSVMAWCWLYTTQQMVINSPCLIDKKELASPEQTVSGKDFSNPLIVDSLLKTIWFINEPCFCNEALAIPGQTKTGKAF